MNMEMLENFLDKEAASSFCLYPESDNMRQKVALFQNIQYTCLSDETDGSLALVNPESQMSSGSRKTAKCQHIYNEVTN